MRADVTNKRLAPATVSFGVVALLFSLTANAEEKADKLSIADCRSVCERADSPALTGDEQKRLQLCTGQKLCGVKPTIVPVYQKYDKDDGIFQRLKNKVYEAVSGHLS